MASELPVTLGTEWQLVKAGQFFGRVSLLHGLAYVSVSEDPPAFGGGVYLTDHIDMAVPLGPTYTGGTTIPVFNMNHRNPLANTVTLLAGATVTDPGTKVSCDKYALGSNPQGGSAVSATTLFNEANGLETLLAANAVYCFQTTSLDTEAQVAFSYSTWFEGEPDLPLQ